MADRTDAQLQASLAVEVSNLRSLYLELQDRMGRFELAVTAPCGCGGHVELYKPPKQERWVLIHMDRGGEVQRLSEAEPHHLIGAASSIGDMIKKLREDAGTTKELAKAAGEGLKRKLADLIEHS